MLTKTTIRLPRNVPARWLTRFCGRPKVADTPYSFRRVWLTGDDRHRVVASQIVYGREPVWWTAEAWAGDHWEGLQGWRHRTARPAFEAVIRAMDGGPEPRAESGERKAES